MENNFTVIIPTRERADVLEHSLKTVVAQDYDNLTIIVSDNFSSDRTKEVVFSFDDPRLRYVNPGERLSMSHHWEFALSYFREGWVTIVGDDDGLLPHAIHDANEIAQKTQLFAIQSKCCYFSWPSVSRSGNGRLRVNLNSGLQIRSSKKWLDKLLDSKCSYADLPTLYTGGFFHSTLVNKIREKGAFFRSRTPDVYTSVISTAFVPCYAYSHRPLAMVGASKHSNGMSVLFNNGQSSKSDTPAKKFLSESNIELHSDVGLLPGRMLPEALEVIVYECFLKAVDVGIELPSGTSKKKQLINALAANLLKESEITSRWCSLFSSANGIDKKSIFRDVRRLAHQKSMLRLKEKLRELYYQVLIDNPRSGIETVYDACIAAASIRESKISHSKNFSFRMKRMIDGTDPF